MINKQVDVFVNGENWRFPLLLSSHHLPHPEELLYKKSCNNVTVWRVTVATLHLTVCMCVSQERAAEEKQVHWEKKEDPR